LAVDLGSNQVFGAGGGREFDDPDARANVDGIAVSKSDVNTIHVCTN
jgi:hypothetical protein